MFGAERERCAALPPADHLRAEQCLVLAAGRFGAEVLPVCGDPGVKFPERQVGAVAAEDLGVGIGPTLPVSSG